MLNALEWKALDRMFKRDVLVADSVGFCLQALAECNRRYDREQAWGGPDTGTLVVAATAARMLIQLVAEIEGRPQERQRGRRRP